MSVCHDFPTLKKILLATRGWDETSLQPLTNFTPLTPKTLGLKSGQIKKALARLQQARAQKETVVIFGDYDVDGNCASAIMWLGLKAFGLPATPFIPDRLQHGYGMSVKALAEIFARKKPQLIITVDNGISALPALEFCHHEKVDVIITDHHQLPTPPPPALALIHTTQLSGAGVAWFLIMQLLAATPSSPLISELLDLVTLATVVDQVPQIGWNRRLVRTGLQQFRRTQRVGLQALAATAGVNLPTVGGHELGFAFGPRLNAIGRLTGTLDSLRLLCTNSPKFAQTLARTLGQVNTQRQQLTQAMFELALQQVDENKLPALIFVAHQDFHEGVIGLLASKLTDRFARPSLVVSVGETTAKGSGRSLGKFNLTSLLQQVQTDLINFGGHALAAGFSVETTKLTQVKNKLQRLAQAALSDQTLVMSLQAQAEVDLAVLSAPQLIPFLDALEPFGAGNNAPLIQIRGQVSGLRYLGNQGQHLKLTLTATKQTQTVLFWNYAQLELTPPKLNQNCTVIGELKIDRFRDQTGVSLIGQTLI